VLSSRFPVCHAPPPSGRQAEPNCLLLFAGSPNERQPGNCLGTTVQTIRSMPRHLAAAADDLLMNDAMRGSESRLLLLQQKDASLQRQNERERKINSTRRKPGGGSRETSEATGELPVFLSPLGTWYCASWGQRDLEISTPRESFILAAGTPLGSGLRVVSLFASRQP